MLNLQQTHLLPLQTQQKVQYWQDKSTVFCYCTFFLGFSVFHNGAIITPGTLRGCLMLLHNMDQFDLCAHDDHLQRVKREEYEGNLSYS